jgi:hypothetical protein
MCRGYVPSSKVKPLKILDETAVKFVKDHSLSKTIRTSSSSSLSFNVPDDEVKKGCLKIKTQTESLKKTVSSSTDDRSVFFSTLEIRTYPLRLGDNPSISSGPPLTISWDSEGDPLVVELEDYEESRPTRRSRKDLIVPKLVR